MPTHEVVNGLGLTYKGTIGLSTATLPDVCKTPSPGGPVPIPYPNFARQSSLENGTTTVFAKGEMIAVKGSHYGSSNGDEAGTAGGVKSNVNMKATDWITYSFDVKLDGKNACRHTDQKFHNNQNAADLQGNIDPRLVRKLGADAAERLCKAICNCVDAAEKEECVAAQFIEEDATWPVHTPTDAELLPEVTTGVGGRCRPLLSETGRITPGGAPAPMSIPKALSRAVGAPGTTTRWDFVQVIDPSKPCTTSNVRRYIEIKFPPNNDLTPNQRAARRRMSEAARAKVVQVSPEDCGC